MYKSQPANISNSIEELLDFIIANWLSDRMNDTVWIQLDMKSAENYGEFM